MPSGRSLLILHDADDLACAEAACTEALSGDVLAFDTDIHLILSDRGIDHLTPWDIVGRDELSALQSYESDIWRHWAAHARIEFDGLNLLDIAKYRHISALARLAWAGYALRRALDHLRPGIVYTFDEPPAHGLDQPVDYRKMPLLFGVFRRLAEVAGIPVYLLSRDAVPGVAGFEDQIAKLGERVYPRVDPVAAIGDRPFVLFQANRTDLLRQLPLIRAIRSRTDCQAVQLYKDAEDDVVRRVAEDGHPIWHESQVARADPPPEIDDLAGRALEAFMAAGRSLTGGLGVVFDNPYVAPHFQFLFGEYARKMAQHVRAWKGFFARCRPAAFVANSHAPIYDVAAAVGIPCLGISHALMMIGQPRWFDSLPEPSLIGAFSELHRDKLIEAGVSPGRIRITGDPHSDRIVDQTRDNGTDSSRSLRRRYGIAADRRIMLICTGSFGMPSKLTHLPFIDWAEGVRSMRDLGELARRRGEWAFLIKCHPRFDYPSLYADVNRTLPADRRFIVLPNEPLVPLAEAADAVCVWSTVTSALIETSLLSKPVMQFARNLVWYDAKAWGAETWPHFHDIAEFEAELDRLLSDPRHWAMRVDQTRDALHRFLGDTAHTTVDRCMCVLEEFISPSG